MPRLAPILSRTMTLVWEHRLILTFLAAVFSAAFAFRFIVISQYPAPPGADYGNYLTNLHAFEGRDVTGGGVQYPAFFLVYLTVLAHFLGEVPALEFSGPFLAALTCFPTYVFLRRFVGPPYAALGATIFVFSEGLSEMIGWGGNPNLLGILFGILFLTFLYDAVVRRTWRARMLAAASLTLLAGSHPVSLAFFGFVALFFLGVYIGVAHRIRAGASALVSIAIGIVLAIPFLPFYATFGQRGADLLPSSAELPSVQDIGFIFTWLFREALIIWVPVAVISVFGYRRLRSKDLVGFSLGVALLASPLFLALTLMAADPVRAFYYIYLGIIPGAMLFLERAFARLAHVGAPPKMPVRWTTVGTALILGVAIYLVGTSYARMNAAADWYYVASEDVLHGLNWIQANTRDGTVVATNGPMKYGGDELVGCMWGWWIEGYAQRPSLCTANPQSMAWQDQVARAEDANRAFYGTDVVENGILRVGDFAPYGTEGNPIVGANLGFGYSTFLSFSDSAIRIGWTPNSTAPGASVSPSELPIQAGNVTLDEDRAVMTHTAMGSNLTVQRTADIDSHSPLVWVNYTVTTTGKLDTLQLPVFGGSQTVFGAYDGVSRAVSVTNVPGFRVRIQATFQIVSATTQLMGIDLVPHPRTGTPVATFRFAPASASFSISLAIESAVARSEPGGPLHIYHGEEILRSHSVELALLDRDDIRHIEWFGRGNPQWKQVYANGGVVLFERTAS